jgi:acetoin utilization protein AcuC
MTVSLVFDPRMAEYRFRAGHPMLPERVSLSVDLMDAWGLLGGGEGQARVVAPDPASDEDLLRVHSDIYVAIVGKEHAPGLADEFHGLGEGDTPRFPHMHEVSKLIAGGTCRALEGVIGGEWRRAFAPAGGLHHAHRDRAAGFCIYNDCAVAIARAAAHHDGLRVAYVDIDAHHGNGVEEAFAENPDVLTLSVHESGRYLYPGTGAARDIGTGPGAGASINVPLPPYSGPDEYRLVLDRVVEPALEAYRPDVILAQLGADSHRDDPLTHLLQTVEGYAETVARLVSCADEVCGGRIAATGGGGYDAFSATPRMWACAMAVLLGERIPDELPASWLERAAAAASDAGFAAPVARRTFDEGPEGQRAVDAAETHRLAERAVDEVCAASPLLGEAGS